MSKVVVCTLNYLIDFTEGKVYEVLKEEAESFTLIDNIGDITTVDKEGFKLIEKGE